MARTNASFRQQLESRFSTSKIRQLTMVQYSSLAEAGLQIMAGSLYVVSTPIGNLDDITVRAVNTLKSVGLVAAEDTRRTDHLLKHFGIATPTTSLHEHNESQKLPQLLRKLAEGTDIALVSDAGTPLVADPGQRLVARAAAEGIRVVPIPGPSAVLAALAVSGYPADEFVFAGFAPSKSNDRKRWLAALAREERTVVFFETPHRINKTLADIAELLGERQITVARELTKVHEQVARCAASSASELSMPARGEFTIVLGPILQPSQVLQPIDDQDLAAYFYQLTDLSRSPRRAAAETAAKFGLSTNDVYARLARLKATTPP
ncbi:MAG: 16S rRNA (cytidine(1402)-2'-O)-methyltransferase [Acidobacteria bacterium]|nr:MAG: 16S rRNA (cytidine(1402)-2'-O)-methyltransferase [Acidobacteriota bacterium]